MGKMASSHASLWLKRNEEISFNLHVQLKYKFES